MFSYNSGMHAVGKENPEDDSESATAVCRILLRLHVQATTSGEESAAGRCSESQLPDHRDGRQNGRSEMAQDYPQGSS